MFETATLSYGPSGKRAWTTAMGFTCQALLVGCVLLAPIVSPQVLPRVTWIASIAPPGPPPPPPGEQAAPRTHAPMSQMVNHRLLLPTLIPSKPLILPEPELPLLASGAGVPGGVMGGSENGVPGGVLNSILNQAARILPVVRPPEVIGNPPPKSAPATLAPPRVTMLKMATPIRKVEPLYPAIAKQARISGTVELLGVLGTDGRIHELKVLRGHPLLVNAAVDAVRQWIFEPTMLNGKAVEVAAPIFVNFILK